MLGIDPRNRPTTTNFLYPTKNLDELDDCLIHYAVGNGSPAVDMKREYVAYRPLCQHSLRWGI